MDVLTNDLSRDRQVRRVVVVGAGLAGSTAAARAAQLGREVVLIDSATDPTAGGNTALSGGGIHVLGADLRADAQVIEERLLSHGWGHTRVPLVDAFVSAAPHARRWLTGAGVRFQPKDGASRQELIPPDTFLEPKRDMTAVHAWPDRGPQQALAKLQQSLERAGGAVRPSARAVELSRNAAGRVDGVVLEGGALIAADAVVLADGGFQANSALLRRFVGPAADRMFLRGAESGTGCGLLMAEAIGARIANPHWFYGHVLHRDVFENDRLWPWPALDGTLLNGAIIVDGRGRRFTDEARGGIHVDNALGWSDDPVGAWVVANARVWASVYESADPVPSNPGLIERGAHVLQAPDGGSLADVAGIDRRGLTATLEAYNGAAENGRTGELPVPRSNGGIALDGDLFAFPAVASITFTMGGIGIDAGARVVDQSGTPVPGLFAAGGAAAGPTAGYIGGLATALIFGYIAGATLGAD
jgi:fumarate reductase flavoprotein subunit